VAVIGAAETADPVLAPELRDAYLLLIEQRAGIRLSKQQLHMLAQAVAELQDTERLASPAALFQAVSSHTRPRLLEELAARLTVPETHFFRVRPQIAALQQTLLPGLLERRADQRHVSIWSAGCSTGEEPYTLAILLRECQVDLFGWRLQILGTDISEAALQAARGARYGDWSFRDTPAEIRERYFTREGGRWRLNSAVRQDVEFARHNLADALPWPCLRGHNAFDLILCRNVTIYFAYDNANALYERLAGLLAPDGWLLLGPCDPPPRHDGPLEAVYLHGAVLWRRGSSGAHPVASARVEPAPSGHKRPPDQGAQVRGGRQAAAAYTGPQPAAELQSSLEPQAQLALGMAYLESGDITAAADALRRAAYLEAANPVTQFTLGRVLLMLGETERARSALLRARRLLAVMANDDQVADDRDLSIGDLQCAVDAQLGLLGADAGNGGAAARAERL
jgi:chemotaxis protein methyltransferase CheR